MLPEMFATTDPEGMPLPRNDAPARLRLAALASALQRAACTTLGDGPCLVDGDEAPWLALGLGWQAGHAGHSGSAIRSLEHDSQNFIFSGDGRRAGRVLLDLWPWLPGDRAWQRLRDASPTAAGPTVFGWRCGALGVTPEQTAGAAMFVEAAIQLVAKAGGSLSRESLLRDIPDRTTGFAPAQLWRFFYEEGQDGSGISLAVV